MLWHLNNCEKMQKNGQNSEKNFPKNAIFDEISKKCFNTVLWENFRKTELFVVRHFLPNFFLKNLKIFAVLPFKSLVIF